MVERWILRPDPDQPRGGERPEVQLADPVPLGLYLDHPHGLAAFTQFLDEERLAQTGQAGKPGGCPQREREVEQANRAVQPAARIVPGEAV